MRRERGPGPIENRKSKIENSLSHPAAWPSDRLLAECDTRRTRRSGPGGQHRNKVETAVVLHHRPTGLSAEAGERRSQQQNQRIALFRLRLKLALEYRTHTAQPPTADVAQPPPADVAQPPPAVREPKDSPGTAEDGRATPLPGPSDLWRSRRRGGRIVVNPGHDDFPALLAEALDAIAAHGMEVKPAADHLGCSTSQLVKLLKAAPPALERINDQRRQRGEPTLK